MCWIWLLGILLMHFCLQSILYCIVAYSLIRYFGFLWKGSWKVHGVLMSIFIQLQLKIIYRYIPSGFCFLNLGNEKHCMPGILWDYKSILSVVYVWKCWNSDFYRISNSCCRSETDSFNAAGSTWFIERLECVFSRQPCKGKIFFFVNFNCYMRKVEVYLCPFLVLAS